MRLFGARGIEGRLFRRASAGAGQGVALPGDSTVWTADGRRARPPSKPVTLTWNNNQGQGFAIKLSVDDGYLFTVQQSVTNGAQAPISGRAPIR